MSGQPTVSTATFRLIRVPAYLILSMAMLLPLLDYANGLVPFKLGDPIWRFGAISLVASYAIATTVQLFFLFVVAVIAGDRKVLYTIAAVALIACITLLAGSGLYGLDALQARSRTSSATQGRLETTAGIAMLKLIVLFIANLILARAAFRAGRNLSAESPIDRVLVPRHSTGSSKAAL